MSPVEITPEFNPLRLPSDRRLNRIAGPSGLIIFGIDGHPEFFLRNRQHFGQKFPCVLDGITLEVITKTEITQHFKKCMMPRGIADILQVIVFAARAYTAL